jgi:hypothetical protein
MTGSFSVPGSLKCSYTPGVGVWRGEDLLLSWCPVVERHLGAYNPRGELTARRVTLTVAGQTATVAMADVADGKVWTDRFAGAAGVGERGTREILRNIVDDQAQRCDMVPVHPRWFGDRLVLPPEDTLPRGYGNVVGSVTDWRLMMDEVARSPRMALVCGLAIGGLFVQPLGRQSYMVHLAGRSSIGKTTTMTAAAALFGNPADVVLPWSVTRNGPGSWLRTLAILTGFRDELGASGFTPQQLEQSIFGYLQGAERDMSGRQGEYRESQGSWHGALMSSGNDGIIGRIANEGIAARVIEIGHGLTLDAFHAERIDRMSEESYGHALRALVDGGPTPAEFADMIGKALSDIGAPDGGPARRLAGHLATGLAGARVLADLCGLKTFAQDVPAAARALLDEMSAGLIERGALPSDRLLAALVEHMAASPATWPTRTSYDANVMSGMYALRDVAGWDTSSDSNVPGDVAALPARLREIAFAAGLTDPRIALAELRQRGLLAPSPDGKNLARLIRAGGKIVRAYVISGLHPATEEESEPVTQESAEVEPAASTAVEPEQLELPDAAPAALVPAQREPEQVPTAVDTEVLTVADHQQPCGWCAAPTTIRIDGQPRHRVRSLCEVMAPAAVEPARPARSARSRTAVATVAGHESTMGEWLREYYPASSRAEREAAEVAWKLVMRQIDFKGAHVTARNILRGSLKHASVPELEPIDTSSLDELMGDDSLRWRGRAWAVPGVELVEGDQLKAYDINGMYLSAAEMELGIGEPIYSDDVPAGWVKRVGWVKLATAPDRLPHGLGARIVAGMWVPIPLAAYVEEWLTERGDMPGLDISRVCIWAKSRRVMRPHVTFMRQARKTLIANGALVKGSPEHMALKALKVVYARMFGGLLRSEKYNDDPTCRADWAALIEANGQQRMFRAIDKAGPDARLVGIHVDAVWFAVPAGHEGHPAGIVCPAALDLGKWKPAGVGTITAAEIEAYGFGKWSELGKLLKV